MPDENVKCDIIYLCSPNNPTGSVYTKEQLKVWIDYAKKNNAIIIYDSAYEAFITEKDVPRSIFAVEGAKECYRDVLTFKDSRLYRYEMRIYSYPTRACC